MQHNNTAGARALTVGAIVGALVAGAAVGVLTAPESGTITRRRLRRGLADLSGSGLRDRWDDLGESLERRRERRERDALVKRLEARIEALEQQLAEAEAEDEEVEEEIEEEQAPSRGHLGPAFGAAAAALLSWFLSSESAAPARERAREVAGRARERAGDEWERFKQRRGAYRKTGDRMVPEGAGETGTQGFQ